MTGMLQAGASLAKAKGAVILLHGRGGSAMDILSLSRELYHPELAYLAPQAPGHTWYPKSFLAPISENEPQLSNSLQQVASVVRSAESTGISSENVLLCGFSQGACLASEFLARNPRRYAGLLAFTGGLIGPPGSDLSRSGSLAGTPVLLSSGDPDSHVPWTRVEETAAILERMGGRVTTQRYPGRPHTISPNELEAAKGFLRQAFPALAASEPGKLGRS